MIFTRKFGNVSDGVSSTAPVFVAKDKVIVGHAGGDSGMRGSVAALSASTGEELWRTYTIPAQGRAGLGDLGRLRSNGAARAPGSPAHTIRS